MTRFKDGKPVEDRGEIPDGDYYTVEEFAERMDVPEGTVRQWIKRGNVISYSCYGRNYISVNAKVYYKRQREKAE